jgi:hypothetical protein
VTVQHSTARTAQCLTCQGNRFLPATDKYNDPPICEACDGEGHFVHVEHTEPLILPFSPAREPRRMYLATSGEEAVEHGRSLDAFVQEMSDGWESGDLAIWLDEDGQALRLVAVVRAQVDGAVVVWI